MNKKTAKEIMKKASIVFEKYFKDKNMLIVYGKPISPQYIETKALDYNFLHLTGVSTKLSPRQFYKQLMNNKLSDDNFELKKDGTTVLKLQILEQTLNMSVNAKMIGDYSGSHIQIQTGKVTGSITSCLGLIKDNGYYIPQTVLKEDARNNIKKGTQSQILAILQKKISEKEYMKVIYSTKKVGNDKLDILELLSKIHKYVPLSNGLFVESNIQSIVMPTMNNNVYYLENPTPEQLKSLEKSGIEFELNPQKTIAAVAKVDKEKALESISISNKPKR